MPEIWQGILIGVLFTSATLLFMFFFIVYHIEQMWKYQDLRAVYAFHYFLTRSKWKSYWRTITS